MTAALREKCPFFLTALSAVDSISSDVASKASMVHHQLLSTPATLPLKKWENHNNTNHNRNAFDLNKDNSKSLFGSTTKCILTPETDVGPFYYPGKLIRRDIRDNQPGLELDLEIQLINIHTCQPISGM
jgi:hypothetical protein